MRIDGSLGVRTQVQPIPQPAAAQPAPAASAAPVEVASATSAPSVPVMASSVPASAPAAALSGAPASGLSGAASIGGFASAPTVPKSFHVAIDIDVKQFLSMMAMMLKDLSDTQAYQQAASAPQLDIQA